MNAYSTVHLSAQSPEDALQTSIDPSLQSDCLQGQESALSSWFLRKSLIGQARIAALFMVAGLVIVAGIDLLALNFPSMATVAQPLILIVAAICCICLLYTSDAADE